MKQTLLFAMLLLACSSSFSQINKGQWLVGGSGTFSRRSSQEFFGSKYKFTSVSISPDGGYFVTNNLAAGARVGFDYSGSKRTGADSLTYKYRSGVWSAAPFVRYYVLSARHRINVLADAAYNWYWNRDNNDGYISKRTVKGYTFHAGPAWFISPQSALELTAGFAHTNDFFEKSTYSLNIGFHQHLGKARSAKKS